LTAILSIEQSYESSGVHSTKTEILARLKRSHGATVDELSSSLGLAPMTIRQHLTALERDGAVSAQEVRRPNGGRPHFLYRLTEDGHRRISAGYDRLLALLVQQAGDLDTTASADPDARRRVLFQRSASALADRYRSETVALPLRARAERIVQILQEHGGFAEWHDLGEGIELRDFNCAFRSMVSRSGPCDWHQTFISRMLDAEVEAAPPEGCDDCCRYIIPARAIAPTTNGSSPT